MLECRGRGRKEGEIEEGRGRGMEELRAGGREGGREGREKK